MHRSRIAVVLIDHPEESYDAAAAFWAAAHGATRASEQGPPDDDPYESLGPLPGGVDLSLQRTGPCTPPRVHLDIETDDAHAETARVVALGARVLTQHDGWAVLEDPGGLVFCVVPVQSEQADFEAHAVTWPDGQPS
ncbi:MAG: VOC family protein [Nocardioidaceae bacterium]